MDTAWDIMDGVVPVLFLFAQAIGDVAQKDVSTTTSRRTSTACDVVLRARVLPLSLNLPIHLPWVLRLISAWDQVRWPVLQDRHLMALALALLALVLHLLNPHQASMGCHLPWVLQVPLSLKWVA